MMNDIEYIIDIDIVIPMYNLIHTVIIIYKYVEVYGREGENETIKVSESYKFKAKITRNTPWYDNTKDVKIAVP